MEKTHFDGAESAQDAEVRDLKAKLNDLAMRYSLVSRVLCLICEQQDDHCIEVGEAEVMSIDPRTQLVPEFDGVVKAFRFRAVSPQGAIQDALKAANEDLQQ